jgi:CheY-like chemotaxis protein
MSSASTTPGALIRVLNVDDDDAKRHYRSEILREAGFEVHEAASGPEALTRLAGTEVDAILLDVHLPGIDGLEVAGA